MRCVMSSLAIFNLCCNAKLICCQFSQVHHQWNVYLVNKTCSRLLYLKCSFHGCLFYFNVPSCIYRLVAAIFIDLFLCLVAFAFPPQMKQSWSSSDLRHSFFPSISANEKFSTSFCNYLLPLLFQPFAHLGFGKVIPRGIPLETSHGSVALVALLWCKVLALAESALGSVASERGKCVPVTEKETVARGWLCILSLWF